MPSDTNSAQNRNVGKGLALLDISIASDFLAVRGALRQVVTVLQNRSAPEDMIDLVQIVLAEALNNVVEHAYCDCSGTIRLSLTCIENGILCRIEDCGHPMPEGRIPECQLPQEREGIELPEGGFGWYLIRSLSREVSYTRMRFCNALSIILDCTQSTKSTRIAS